MAVLLANVKTALSFLLGEESLPNPWPTSRTNAIQWALERIARYYDFDFGKTSISVTTNSSGVYTLLTADGIRFDAELDVRIVRSGVSNDQIFERVLRENWDEYTTGDYKYYVSTAANGAQSIVTTEASTTIQITGSSIAPTLDDVTGTSFPSALVIAKGALVYVKEFEDKDADVSVEDAKFLQGLNEIIGQEQRVGVRSRALGRQEASGRYTGQVFE